MNKSIVALSMVVASLGIAVAAVASTVEYDIDRGVDFSTWQRMAWATPKGPELTIQERRISRAVENGFASKGYTLVEDKANADFLIDYRATAWQEARVGETFSRGFGRSLYVDREQRGALVVVVIERKTGKIAWRGTVSDALAKDPDQAEKRLAKAIEKLMKKFPTRGGGK
jgi:hypothetical protein